MTVAEADAVTVTDNPVRDLLLALLAVQAAAPTLIKDKTARVQSERGASYSYAYLSLDSIMETVGPLLAEHGLIWTTQPSYNAQTGTPVLRYQLWHVDGGRLADEMPLLLPTRQDRNGNPLAPDSQALGSAITYARRYALTAVLNLVADEDDDGGAASPRTTGGVAPSSVDEGPTVNLQNEAKGLRNEAINNVFARIGLPPQEKPWGQLGRIPEHLEEAAREQLRLAREIA